MGRTDFEKKPTSYILPDLVSDCKYKLTVNHHEAEVSKKHVKWLDSGCPELNSKSRRAMYGLQAGLLAAVCYTTANRDRLQVVADYLGYLFHLDNISDGMMTKETDTLANVVMNAFWFPDDYRPTEMFPEEPTPGKLARDLWRRCIKDCGPRAQHRFLETMNQFFETVSIQAKSRDDDHVLDLEYFVDIRRDTSGCKPCYALVEYAAGVDLPDEVFDHPIIQALGQYSNDLVAWSNDLFSYNVEQSRGDGGHNMITILMKYHGHTLQSAVDYMGRLCSETIANFEVQRNLLPSWGAEVDADIAAYIQGLQDWIVGSLHWSFQSQRYFGTRGQIIKKNRYIRLLPPRKKMPKRRPAALNTSPSFPTEH